MPIGFHSNIILTFDFDNFLSNSYILMAYKYFPTKSSVYIVYSLYHINFGFLTIFCTDARDCLYLKFYKIPDLYLINIPKVSQLVVIETDFMLQKGKVD